MKEFDEEKILEENEKLKQENEKLREYLERLETKIVNTIKKNTKHKEYQNIDNIIDKKYSINTNMKQESLNKEILTDNIDPQINNNINWDIFEVNENKSNLFEDNYSLNNEISKNHKSIALKKMQNLKEIEDNFEDMSIISFLARSEKRVQILKTLTKEDKIPSIISKEIGDENHHVSKHLKSLKEKGLIICLNEDDKRFRFYSITTKGRKYLKKFEEKNY